VSTRRCSSRAPKAPLPPSMTVETARLSPAHRHLLEPTAQCELPARHGARTAENDIARRHRNGGLLWWDPPIVEIREIA
jgi:hypothetical protein